MTRQRAPSNFLQRDVARAVRAVKGSGLDIAKVEVDPKTAKITLVMKDGSEVVKTENPFDGAPTWDPALHRRRSK
jgi:hypothetical protein